jgi:hypothetical protein
VEFVEWPKKPIVTLTLSLPLTPTTKSTPFPTKGTNASDIKWTLQYQAKIILGDVDVAIANPNISGICLWHFYDFKVDNCGVSTALFSPATDLCSNQTKLLQSHHELPPSHHALSPSYHALSLSRRELFHHNTG